METTVSNNPSRPKTELKVIIRCLVYNQELYLRDCLEGFVMQKTSFPFKAVVHDDCSTDGSTAIIREYAEKYPDIIEPIYETENLYSKGDGSLGRAMNKACNGRSEYFALCEGDDYWIDPYKLQKQVDFLDKNPEYSMCFSSCVIENHTNNSPSIEGENIEDRDYSATDLYKTWVVPTASICLRSEVWHHPIWPKIKGLYYGDIFIILVSSLCGKIRGMKEAMVTYRIHNQSITNNPKYAAKRTKKLLIQSKSIMRTFKNIDRNVCRHNVCGLYLILIRESSSKWEKLKYYLAAGLYEPRRMFPIYFTILKSYVNKLWNWK